MTISTIWKFARACTFIAAIMTTLSASAIDIKITAKSDGTSRPMITGTTNLPDGAILNVSVERKQTGYGGGTKATVSNGTFSAGPFGDSSNGGPLRAGSYSLSVTLIYAGMQPENVQAVMGERGSKLKGKLVERSEIAGKTASYNTKFSVDGKSTPQQDEKMKQRRHDQELQNFCQQGCQLNSQGNAVSYSACMRSCTKP